jgi:hypothetical protein
MVTQSREHVDPADDALTDLEGILHALDIIRFEDALNKPGRECYALNVLIPLAIEKADALRQAMSVAAATPCACRRQMGSARGPSSHSGAGRTGRAASSLSRFPEAEMIVGNCRLTRRRLPR